MEQEPAPATSTEGNTHGSSTQPTATASKRRLFIALMVGIGAVGAFLLASPAFAASPSPSPSPSNGPTHNCPNM